MPKGRFAYIFPNKSSALIQVRFRSNLSESERDRAIGLVRQAVAMPEWKLPNGKGTYVVTGAPVVVSDLTRSISHSLIALLVAALVVMALTLTLVFRARLRLLPLVVALAAAGLTFGALSLAGASLTMASIAVLPVLIGLVRRLRDPAAGAGAGGPGRGGRDRGGGAAHGGARRPDGGDRRRRHGGRLPRPRALAGADGARLRACCWWQASRSPWAVR